MDGETERQTDRTIDTSLYTYPFGEGWEKDYGINFWQSTGVLKVTQPPTYSSGLSL